MPLVLNIAPASEPVTLSDVKDHSVVEITDDDSLLSGFISQSRAHLENETKRAFITQTWDYYLDGFSDEMVIPKSPLQSVTAITYVDDNGATQTLSASVYTVDAYSDLGRVVLAYGQSWPTTRDVINAVKITFVCGYGSASSVPESLKLAINLLVNDFSENRGDSSVISLTSLPVGVEALISPHRVRTF